MVRKKNTDEPLGEGFDKVIPDSYNDCDTYEEAEARMQRSARQLATAKCNLDAKDIGGAFQSSVSIMSCSQISVSGFFFKNTY